MISIFDAFKNWLSIPGAIWHEMNWLGRILFFLPFSVIALVFYPVIFVFLVLIESGVVQKFWNLIYK